MTTPPAPWWTRSSLAVGPVDQRVVLGAKLGAILSGLVRTALDSSGTPSLQFQSVWTPLDLGGHRLEIYGSGGWVFESPRARFTILVNSGSVSGRLVGIMTFGASHLIATAVGRPLLSNEPVGIKDVLPSPCQGPSALSGEFSRSYVRREMECIDQRDWHDHSRAHRLRKSS